MLPFGFYDRQRGSECTPTYSVATRAYACTPSGAAPSADDPELELVADRDGDTAAAPLGLDAYAEAIPAIDP